MPRVAAKQGVARPSIDDEAEVTINLTDMKTPRALQTALGGNGIAGADV